MNLPIDLVPNSRPPKFRWRQVVDSPVGARSVEHEGTVAPSMEAALRALVSIAKQLALENEEMRKDNRRLQEQLNAAMDRIGAQSDLLSKKAEVAQAPLPTQPIKRRG